MFLSKKKNVRYNWTRLPVIQCCDTMELSNFEGKSDFLILIAHKIIEVSLENGVF